MSVLSIPTLRGKTTIGCVNDRKVVLFATTGEAKTSEGEICRRSISRYLKYEDEVTAEDANSYITPFNELGIRTHQWYGSIKVQFVEWNEKRTYPIVSIIGEAFAEICLCRLWLTDCPEYAPLFKGVDTFLAVKNVAAFKEHADDKESHIVAARGISTIELSRRRTPLALVPQQSVVHQKNERQDSPDGQKRKSHRAEKEVPAAASKSGSVEESDTVSTPRTDDSSAKKSDSKNGCDAVEGDAALSGGRRLGGVVPDDDDSPVRAGGSDRYGCTARDLNAQRRAAAAADARAKKLAGRKSQGKTS